LFVVLLIVDPSSQELGPPANPVRFKAMGFSDDDYLASKATTHPRMRLLGPLLTIEPTDVEKDRVGDLIAAALDL
jgi:hypothetical protein